MLEHVLDPADVVAEIVRVLKPDGLVYAETPFMQQVHEQAYDFTRFTKSGHRWLFRRFAGDRCGRGQWSRDGARWSIRYWVRTLTGSNKLATLATLPIFLAALFRSVRRPRARADAASGVYFLGRKSTTSLRPRDMVAYYGR